MKTVTASFQNQSHELCYDSIKEFAADMRNTTNKLLLVDSIYIIFNKDVNEYLGTIIMNIIP
jgi:hypothetical protein